MAAWKKGVSELEEDTEVLPLGSVKVQDGIRRSAARAPRFSVHVSHPARCNFFCLFHFTIAFSALDFA